MAKTLKFNQAGTACDIEKMPNMVQWHPDLADVDLPEVPGNPQADDDLEKKVVAGEPWACYDDSIATIAMTALAYREGLPAPTGRTKVFDALQSQTGKSGKLIDASVVKLHWQYQTAAAANNYYFHELLNDFDQIAPPFQNYPSIPYEACYSNKYGACFRDAATPHVTNEYVRNLLDRNFLVMLAWRAYNPKAVYDPAVQGLRVTFEQTDWHHKVVVRGYQLEKLPLTINYINGEGAGKVSLRSSLAPSPFVSGKGVQNNTGVRLKFGSDPAHPDAHVRAVEYPGGASAPCFVEYDGQANPGDVVVFLEHVDALCLDWRQGERKVTMGFNWGSGWTHLVPFKRDGLSYMVAYNAASGLVHFDLLKTNGAHGPFAGSWAKGWTHVLTYGTGGPTHVLVYNSQSGAARLYRVRDDLLGADVVFDGTWPKWTHLAAFHHRADPHLFLYDSASGKVHIDRVSLAPGGGTQVVYGGFWEKGWTHFMPFQLNGVPHLVAYNSKSGQARFARVNKEPAGTTALLEETWPAGFTSLTPVDYAGLPHFTAYNSATGALQFRRVAKGGKAVQTLWSGAHNPNCSGVVPFRVGGEAYQFFYASGAPALTRFNWQPL